MNNMLITSFIGVPCVGKGTIIRNIQERMLDNWPVAVITTSDLVRQLLTDTDREAMKDGGLFPREAELRELLYSMIEDLDAFGAKIILLDGFPRFDDQMRWLRQTFYDVELQIIQVIAPNEFVLLQRAQQRNRDAFDQPDKFMSRVYTQRTLLTGVEHMIGQYAIPYTTVINDDIERATIDAIAKIRWPGDK